MPYIANVLLLRGAACMVTTYRRIIIRTFPSLLLISHSRYAQSATSALQPARPKPVVL